MLRLLLMLLVLSTSAISEESSPREPVSKAEAAQSQDQHRGGAQQITVPANNSSPTIINIIAGKHSGHERECAKPKDWKEWTAFAWCKFDTYWDAERTIAAFTVILAIATGLLFWATRALVRGAEQTAEAQLRPYVSMRDASFEWYANNLRVIATVANTGQTPATFFELGCISRVGVDGEQDETIPADTEYKAWASLGGGDTTTISIRNGLSDENAREVLDAAGGKIFMIVGRVRYGDVFGSEYESEFIFFTRDVRPSQPIKMMRSTGRVAAYRKTKSG